MRQHCYSFQSLYVFWRCHCIRFYARCIFNVQAGPYPSAPITRTRFGGIKSRGNKLLVNGHNHRGNDACCSCVCLQLKVLQTDCVKEQKKIFKKTIECSNRGSNSGPLPCEGNVITATLLEQCFDLFCLMLEPCCTSSQCKTDLFNQLVNSFY